MKMFSSQIAKSESVELSISRSREYLKNFGTILYRENARLNRGPPLNVLYDDRCGLKVLMRVLQQDTAIITIEEIIFSTD
jgi:hypothetical protein